jgi:hypothetical protein
MSSKRIIAVFVLIELIIVLIGYLTEGFTLSALQTITRFSGRLSLLLFSGIFLFYNRPSAIKPWLSDRFYLLFAIVHGIHLIELLLFVSLSGMQLIPYRVAGGILAYLYIFAMPILQVYKERARISGRNYATAEIIFIYYVWLIFFLTYLPRVQGKVPNAGGTFAEHVALLGWVSTLLGMKLAGLIQFQKSRPNKRS